MKERSYIPSIEEAKTIDLCTYDYPLQNDRIAKYPLIDRTACKLLCYDAREDFLQDTYFYNLPNLLSEDTLILRNNSRVIHARIEITRDTGARIEIFCLSPHQPSSYEESLSSKGGTIVWRCLVGNSKKWKNTPLKKEVIMPDGGRLCLTATRSLEDPFLIQFQYFPNTYTFGEVLDTVGSLPIPPYLGRDTQESDLKDYQTIYATQKGSVAAPTAGLHFTEKLTNDLLKKGIEVADVTLHVGAGTFLPVKGDDVANHVMHSEVCMVSRTTIETLLKHQETTLAVGTTSVRTLESLYYLAQNHLDELTNNPIESPLPHIDQWEPYLGNKEEGYSLLKKLLNKMNELHIENLFYSTALFIIPGYNFHYTSQLITNFHQPKSTLLLMISAFIGETWEKIYQYALEHKYRFLSYGDACLFTRKNTSH